MDEQPTLYKERDIEGNDALWELYRKHIWAMTVFSLHNKAAIAAELAHRDLQIQSREQQLAELQEKYSDLIMEVSQQIPDESCHDTAKRYIRERGDRELEPQQALNTTSKEG